MYSDAGDLDGAYDFHCKTNNRYGLKKCSRLKEEFLGQKDVGAFLGSFGVRVTCELDARDIVDISQASTDSRVRQHQIHEIWFHKNSNDPRRKISQAFRTCYDSPPTDFPKCKSGENVATIQLLTLVNAQEKMDRLPSAVPPALFGKFKLAGDVLTPGTYQRRFECTRESATQGIWRVWSMLDIIFWAADRSNPTTFDNVSTMASPSTLGLATSSIITFWNQDWFRRNLGAPDITVKKLDENYFSFNMTNTVTMQIGANSRNLFLKSTVSMPEIGYCFGAIPRKGTQSLMISNMYSFIEN